MSTQAPQTIIEHWDITYTHDMGPIVSEFYDRLANDEIWGRHCPKCDRVLVPPRSFCDRDFTDTDRWVAVQPHGTIETYTVVFQKFKGLPDPPYCIAYVLLDGADSSILNFVKLPEDFAAGDAQSRLKIGQRVTVVFAPKASRTGRITDFWFEVDSAR